MVLWRLLYEREPIYFRAYGEEEGGGANQNPPPPPRLKRGEECVWNHPERPLRPPGSLNSLFALTSRFSPPTPSPWSFSFDPSSSQGLLLRLLAHSCSVREGFSFSLRLASLSARPGTDLRSPSYSLTSDGGALYVKSEAAAIDESVLSSSSVAGCC